MPLGGFRLNGLARYEAVAASETSKAVQFESVNSEYYYANSLTASSVTANKTGTISFWWNPVSATARGVIVGCMSTATYPGQNALFFENTAAGAFRIYSYGNGGVQIDASSPSSSFVSNTWKHVVISWDSTSTSTRYCYINGSAVTMTYNTYNSTLNTGLAYLGYIGIGARNNNGTRDLISNGSLSQLWIDNSYIDLSVSTNRQKFYNSGWVAMGTDGTGSGLSRPLIYHNGDTSTSPAFLSNQGRTGSNYVSYTLIANGTINNVTGP